jgi:hypothetical protein
LEEFLGLVSRLAGNQKSDYGCNVVREQRASICCRKVKKNSITGRVAELHNFSVALAPAFF